MIELNQHFTLLTFHMNNVFPTTASGKYYASVLFDDAKENPTPDTISTDRSVGIDLGLSHAFILSTGIKKIIPGFSIQEYPVCEWPSENYPGISMMCRGVIFCEYCNTKVNGTVKTLSA
ncbi:hypothetical protein VY86_03665 [Photorhabdus thracensis]|uniref:Uncharacterized protein n=1 Tax=Photorhabdus thracensis TaxID=230089 RepID=A0A0F7LHJ2_9GAMM|nr:hypothetical protein VY86_03665 [Photorhabdus thracensis]